MNGDTLHHRPPPTTTTTTIKLKKNKKHNSHCNPKKKINYVSLWFRRPSDMGGYGWWWFGDASFKKWTANDVWKVLKHHPIPCLLAVSVLFFMGVEYTLRMIPSSSPPFDIGFVATVHLHHILTGSPALNTLLAGLNTVFVGMQTAYIMWTWAVEGRPRATIAALLMFTFRGILGYSTQLPLPQGFLGSGADFPVGNVSFFLFYSGHVAASVIASLDMRRMHRWGLAFVFDIFNILQVVRLLSTRGHYTIDLVVGVGAAILFDSVAQTYIQAKDTENGIDLKCNGSCKAFFVSPNGA